MNSSSIGKALQICLITISALSLALASRDTLARSRMGSATVTTEANLPCFKIDNKEEKSRGPTSLKMLSISEITPDGAKNMWTLMFPNTSFGSPTYRLPENSCVRYGQVPTGAEASNARPLKMGKIYSVSFLGRPISPSDPTSRYSAKFCVLSAPSGGFHAIQLIGHEEACPAELPPK